MFAASVDKIVTEFIQAAACAWFAAWCTGMVEEPHTGVVAAAWDVCTEEQLVKAHQIWRQVSANRNRSWS